MPPPSTTKPSLKPSPRPPGWLPLRRRWCMTSSTACRLAGDVDGSGRAGARPALGGASTMLAVLLLLLAL
jgi:hypothetical protein